MKSKYAYVHKDGSGFDKHGLWQHAGQLFLISHIDKDLKFSVWEEYVIKRFYKITLKKKLFIPVGSYIINVYNLKCFGIKRD